MHLYLRNRATANVRLVLEFMGSYDCGEFFFFLIWEGRLAPN